MNPYQLSNSRIFEYKYNVFKNKNHVYYKVPEQFSMIGAMASLLFTTLTNIKWNFYDYQLIQSEWKQIVKIIVEGNITVPGER